MNKLETVSEKIKLFCEYSEAFKINPIIVPHLIEESIKNELDQKAKIIFESMKNIWYFLKQNYSTYEIENTLFTNKLIIEKLKKRSDNIQFKTLRIDFLIDKNNHPKICELNIDSSIGMAESQYFAEIYLNEMGLENSTFSPFSQLGYLIKNLSTQKEINKICLFDLSIWENTGYFNLNHMMDKLRIHLPNMEIFSANEKDILSKVDNKTLVYRVFPDDDYFEYQEIIDCLENNCAEIISEVEYGIFGNKIWLYLLQCDKFKDVIGSENFKIIKSIIPETFLLNENNIHPILEDKNNYFFKNVTGFGGKSVFDGKNT